MKCGNAAFRSIVRTSCICSPLTLHLIYVVDRTAVVLKDHLDFLESELGSSLMPFFVLEMMLKEPPQMHWTIDHLHCLFL